MQSFNITLILSLMLLNLLSLKAQKHKLHFNEDKEFKIMQVTDTHYDHTNPKSDIVIKMFNDVLEIENPDLVVLTGDIVGGKETKEMLSDQVKGRSYIIRFKKHLNCRYNFYRSTIVK